MSEDDKSYLRRHNIHVLLDSLAKDMITQRPDNPQQFVVEWLKVREEDDVEGKPPQKRLVKVAIPDTPQQMCTGDVKTLLETAPDSIVVVDVRNEIIGGSIAGSVHITADDFAENTRTMAEKWVDKTSIVFCSALSPDLDQPAAASCLRVLAELNSTAEVWRGEMK